MYQKALNDRRDRRAAKWSAPLMEIDTVVHERKVVAEQGGRTSLGVPKHWITPLKYLNTENKQKNKSSTK